MKGADALVAIVVAMLGDAVTAQSDPTIDRLKICSRAEATERLKCVNELLGGLVEAPDSVPAQGPHWVISETTSPVNYRPQIVASIAARSSTPDAPSALTLLCRAQRAELIISASRASKPFVEGEATVSYRINDEAPVEQRWRIADNGHGFAFLGDVMRLVRLMPDGGQLHVRIQTGTSPALESLFDLAGVDAVRRRVAAACNAPQP